MDYLRSTTHKHIDTAGRALTSINMAIKDSDTQIILFVYNGLAMLSAYKLS